MEEISRTNSSTQNQHPNTLSKKRKFSNAVLRTSSFKIRALVRQLRPLFIQGCGAEKGKYVVVEIEAGGYLFIASAGYCRHQIFGIAKQLMNYKCMKVKIDLPETLRSECQAFSVESVPGKKPNDGQDGKEPESHQFKHHSSQSAQKETIAYIESKMKVDDGRPRESYIVGGSVFGWNFITFRGSAPVYYGVTKEGVFQKFSFK